MALLSQADCTLFVGMIRSSLHWSAWLACLLVLNRVHGLQVQGCLTAQQIRQVRGTHLGEQEAALPK